MDSKRFVLLVVILTLVGSSEFVLCEGRSGPVIETIMSKPGTLVLLRAPGFARGR